MITILDHWAGADLLDEEETADEGNRWAMNDLLEGALEADPASVLPSGKSTHSRKVSFDFDVDMDSEDNDGGVNDTRSESSQPRESPKNLSFFSNWRIFGSQPIEVPRQRRSSSRLAGRLSVDEGLARSFPTSRNPPLVLPESLRSTKTDDSLGETSTDASELHEDEKHPSRFLPYAVFLQFLTSKGYSEAELDQLKELYSTAFHRTHSSNLTNDPPKMSSEL